MGGNGGEDPICYILEVHCLISQGDRGVAGAEVCAKPMDRPGLAALWVHTPRFGKGEAFEA